MLFSSRPLLVWVPTSLSFSSLFHASFGKGVQAVFSLPIADFVESGHKGLPGVQGPERSVHMFLLTVGHVWWCGIGDSLSDRLVLYPAINNLAIWSLILKCPGVFGITLCLSGWCPEDTNDWQGFAVKFKWKQEVNNSTVFLDPSNQHNWTKYFPCSSSALIQ